MCALTLVEKAIENVLSSFNIAAVFFRCCCCCWSAIGHTVYFILIELNNINLQAALCEYRFDLNRFKLILRYLTNSRRTSRQAVPKSFTRCCLRHCYWWFRNRREELCLNFFSPCTTCMHSALNYSMWLRVEMASTKFASQEILSYCNHTVDGWFL